MNFQDYISSLKVGDRVIVKEKSNFYDSVVDKITPTGIFKITPNFNNFLVYSFDKYGKSRGGNYNISIVNKFDEASMKIVKLSQARNKMKINVTQIVTFLERHQNSYTFRNNEIVTNIQNLLEDWQS
jgi:hypothetical protein